MKISVKCLARVSHAIAICLRALIKRNNFNKFFNSVYNKTFSILCTFLHSFYWVPTLTWCCERKAAILLPPWHCQLLRCLISLGCLFIGTELHHHLDGLGQVAGSIPSRRHDKIFDLHHGIYSRGERAESKGSRFVRGSGRRPCIQEGSQRHVPISWRGGKKAIQW